MKRRLCSMIVVAMIMSGCAAKSPTSAPATTGQATGLQNIEISSGGLVSAFDPAKFHYDVTSLNTLGNIKVKVITAPGAAASIDGVSLPSGQWKPLPVTILDKSAAIPIAVTSSAGTPQTYQLATLPSDFPDYGVTANDPDRGMICFTANANDGKSPSYVFVTDELGHPIFYKKTPGLAFNLQRFTAPDGTARYAFLEVEGPQLPDGGTFRGTVRLLDGSFNQLKSLSLLPTTDHPALPAELHDFVYVNDNDYLMEAFEPKTVSNIPSLPGATSSVLAAVIEEVKDGRVVFDWDSTNDPEFYANASDGNDYTDKAQPDADYMHMNSICVDPRENNLIVSFRHQDQIVKLDRTTGAIMWRLGGKDSDFALTTAQQFSHQHYVRMAADGTLTVFDNGNAAQQTHLLAFKLDETSKTVTSFQDSTHETRYTPAMGSFQILDPTHLFVGWGSRNGGPTDAEEIAPDGTQDFSLTFTNPIYSSYRALKYLD
ncbi:MAG: arylsulfotransferase family protein [Cyanobacteria bacterium REEB65]|nr:arylsulfotransferase family protein [Cyanobacteria bacterium REEB65]